MRKIYSPIILTLAFIALVSSPELRASADRQSFVGGGLGVEVLSKDGSGTGFYMQLQGGYNFNSVVGLGLHAGYANVGGTGIRTFDFGGFLQLTESDSGVFGRLYLDGINAGVNGGGTIHGVKNTQTGFAPGVALGMLIPSAGDFHMAPELSYRAAFLDSMVNLIDATFNLVWDF